MDLALLGKSAIALGFMGAVAGILLSVAAKRFHVEVDPRIEAVYDALPGGNCGACGMPSCFSVAEAMVAGEVEPTACTAGGQTTSDAIAEILGTESCEMAAVVSVRHCGGGTNAERSYEYDGVATCAAVSRLAGSPLACPAGCIGLGDCERACAFGAISFDARGLPTIDPEACTGCEACVNACPRAGSGLLAMVPAEAPVAVRCVSHDKAKAKRSYCSMSCIACKKCEKECPSDAIHVVDFVAVVDYDACTGCGICVSVCPQDCIDLHGRDAIAGIDATDGRGAAVPGFEPESQDAAEQPEVADTAPEAGA